MWDENIAFGRPGASRRDVVRGGESGSARTHFHPAAEGRLRHRPAGARHAASLGQRQLVAFARRRRSPTRILGLEAPPRRSTSAPAADRGRVLLAARTAFINRYLHDPNADLIVVLGHAGCRAGHARGATAQRGLYTALYGDGPTRPSRSCQWRVRFSGRRGASTNALAALSADFALFVTSFLVLSVVSVVLACSAPSALPRVRGLTRRQVLRLSRPARTLAASHARLDLSIGPRIVRQRLVAPLAGRGSQARHRCNPRPGPAARDLVGADRPRHRVPRAQGGVFESFGVAAELAPRAGRRRGLRLPDLDRRQPPASASWAPAARTLRNLASNTLITPFIAAARTLMQFKLHDEQGRSRCRCRTRPPALSGRGARPRSRDRIHSAFAASGARDAPAAGDRRRADADQRAGARTCKLRTVISRANEDRQRRRGTSRDAQRACAPGVSTTTPGCTSRSFVEHCPKLLRQLTKQPRR